MEIASPFNEMISFWSLTWSTEALSLFGLSADG
jgi:hypothetical protein